MVDAKHIVKPQLMGDPTDPPGIPVGLHPLPVKERVAPKLAVDGKGVGRAARHLGGHQLPVQLKQLRPGPHIGGIQRHIDGQVPDQADTPAIDILFKFLPLPEEKILHSLPKVRLLPQLLPGPGQSVRLPAAKLFGPLPPGRTAARILQCHEKGVIGQPVCVFR